MVIKIIIMRSILSIHLDGATKLCPVCIFVYLKITDVLPLRVNEYAHA